MRHPLRGILFILPLLCTGCLILPIPHQESSLSRRPGIACPDHARFIRANVTTRQDVLLKLGEPDLSWDDDRTFLYHWATTDFAVLWAVGGYYSGAAGVHDFPKTHDLLIQFDPAGHVLQSEIVNDVPIDKLYTKWPALRPAREKS